MNFCLVADDGEAQVVTHNDDNVNVLIERAEQYSFSSVAKWHICRREPSHNGTQRVVIETWEKGKKV